MNIDEIIQHLPHRYPFLLVDRVLEIEPNKSIHAIKNVTINEPFFVGHFPVKPVMPGVLMLEALAQAAAILSYVSANQKAETVDSLYYFAAIDDVRFKKIVTPGDQLHLYVEQIFNRRGVIKVKGTAMVDGEEACTSHLMFAKST